MAISRDITVWGQRLSSCAFNPLPKPAKDSFYPCSHNHRLFMEEEIHCLMCFRQSGRSRKPISTHGPQIDLFYLHIQHEVFSSISSCSFKVQASRCLQMWILFCVFLAAFCCCRRLCFINEMISVMSLMKHLPLAVITISWDKLVLRFFFMMPKYFCFKAHFLCLPDADGIHRQCANRVWLVWEKLTNLWSGVQFNRMCDKLCYNVLSCRTFYLYS